MSEEPLHGVLESHEDGVKTTSELRALWEKVYHRFNREHWPPTKEVTLDLFHITLPR